MRLRTVLAKMFCQVYVLENFGNIHTVSMWAQNHRLTLSNIESLRHRFETGFEFCNKIVSFRPHLMPSGR